MGKIAVGTPQQRKDEPSSGVDGLWSLIITRCLEGNITNHHYFVIDVVESCLPSSMFCTLGLPPAFMTHYRERLKQHITLQGENGRRWATMLGLQLDSQYCLNLGWKEFAVDHDLEVNDKLAFFLFEDSHFVVKVFNSSKRKVPERGGDGSARMVSQAGMQPREASLAEKTKATANTDVQVQAQRQGTNDPLPYHDKNLRSVRAPREVDANPEERDVIQIPDSSEEEDDLPSGRIRRDDMPATPPFRGGASGIKLRAKQTIPKGINRAARVGAENQTQATQEDVRDSIKGQTPRQSNRLAEMAEQSNPTQKHAQLCEDQNEAATLLGTGSIRNATASTHPASRSPPSSASPPSSPEHMPVLKRSTKPQRGYDKDDDYFPSSAKAETISKLSQEGKGKKTALRSENVSVPGVNAECNPVEMPTGKPKRGGVASNANKVAESEILAGQPTKKQPRLGQPLQQTAGKMTEDPKIRAPNNKKKKAQESLPKGMKRTQETPLGQPATEGLNATESVAGIVADDGGTGPTTQENGGSKVLQSAPPQTPGGVRSRTTVKQRHKVKVHKDKGDKNKDKACPPPEETRPPPEEEPTTVFKRPTKIARLGPAKPHKLIYVSRRRPVTDQERNDTLAKAQEYAQSRSAINKHSVIQLRVSQVYCGYHLGVPPDFVEALQLPLVKEKMTFYDATGKTWEVDWQGDHPVKPGFNSFGWTKFVLDHCLEEGDVCVFELPDPKVFNISVTIFPIVPLTAVPELGWKSHYGGEHTGEKSGLATPSQG